MLAEWRIPVQNLEHKITENKRGVRGLDNRFNLGFIFPIFSFLFLHFATEKLLWEKKVRIKGGKEKVNKQMGNFNIWRSSRNWKTYQTIKKKKQKQLRFFLLIFRFIKVYIFYKNIVFAKFHLQYSCCYSSSLSPSGTLTTHLVISHILYLSLVICLPYLCRGRWNKSQFLSWK